MSRVIILSMLLGLPCYLASDIAAASSLEAELKQIRNTKALADAVAAKSDSPVAKELAKHLREIPNDRLVMRPASGGQIQVQFSSSLLPISYNEQTDESKINNRSVRIDWNGDFQLAIDEISKALPGKNSTSGSALIRLVVPKAEAISYPAVALVGAGALLVFQQYSKCRIISEALAHCQQQLQLAKRTQKDESESEETLVAAEKMNLYGLGLNTSGFLCTKKDDLKKCVIARGYDPRSFEKDSSVEAKASTQNQGQGTAK